MRYEKSSNLLDDFVYGICFIFFLHFFSCTLFSRSGYKRLSQFFFRFLLFILLRSFHDYFLCSIHNVGQFVICNPTSIFRIIEYLIKRKKSVFDLQNKSAFEKKRKKNSHRFLPSLACNTCAEIKMKNAA